MDRLWNSVLAPLCEAASPGVVVLVGRNDGIIEGVKTFCRDTDARMHWIDSGSETDPGPVGGGADPASAGSAVVVHRGLSLNALSRIEDADLIVLAGDPNWYTTHQQLKLIERQAQALGREFPVVVLRGVDWPYGRRDAYTDPEAIPGAYRKPYDRSDRIRAIADADPASTILPRARYAAREEAGDRNGILSAVEDFLIETELPLRFTKLPGNEGVGIVTTDGQTDRARAIAEVLSTLAPDPQLAEWIEGIERARIEAGRQLASERGRGDRYRARVRRRFTAARRTIEETEEALRVSDDEALRLAEAVIERDDRIEQLEKELTLERMQHDEIRAAWARERDCMTDEIETRDFEIRGLQEGQDVFEEELEEKENEVDLLKRLVHEGQQAISKVRSKLDSMERGIKTALGTERQDDAPTFAPAVTGVDGDTAIEPLVASLEELVRRRERDAEAGTGFDSSRWTILADELRQVDGNLDTVVAWIDRLDRAVSNLLRSKRWRIGDQIGKVHRRILRRPPELDAKESIDTVLEDYRTWKEKNVNGVRIVRTSEHELEGHLGPAHMGVALFHPDTRRFLFRYSLTPGDPDDTFRIDAPPEDGIPIAGDWHGTGRWGLGYYDSRRSAFHIKRTPGGGPMDLTIRFGKRDRHSIPLVGDWNGDGNMTIGLFDPARSSFHLRNTLAAGPSDLEFRFGPAGAGWIPIVGDWDGDGKDEIGLYEPERSRFHLRFELAEGDPDAKFGFGARAANMIPLAGDWALRGRAGIGLYDPTASEFYLKHALAGGEADIHFSTPVPDGDWIPLVGSWGST